MPHGRLLTWSHRPALFASPGSAHGGDAGAGFLALCRAFFRRLAAWLACHGIAVILAAPWLPHYFDHSPEFLSGRLPVKFLLGTPIGFIGGNSAVLLGLVVLIVYGIARRARAFTTLQDWAGPVCLVLWLVVPPVLLYAYSWLASPIFGPARYTVFVAPAYLILIGQGLSRAPKLVGWSLGLAIPLISASALGPTVYAADLKADWRGLAESIEQSHEDGRGLPTLVIVSPAQPENDVEIEVARYYIKDSQTEVISLAEATPERLAKAKGNLLYLVLGKDRNGSGTPPSIPESLKSYKFKHDWGDDGRLESYFALPPPGSP